MSTVDTAVRTAIARCNIGDVRCWAPIATGYEDPSLDVLTTAGRFVVKLFDPRHRGHIPARIAHLVALVRRQGVRHPLLLSDRDGLILHHTPAGTALVMRRLPAADYYVLGRPPTRTELAHVIEQAARVHTVFTSLPPIHDPWAIPNLPALARELRPRLDVEQRDLVTAAVDAYTSVDHRSLPRVLIHGDLTKGNVLADPDGAVALIDFACADHHPRVQELAVIAANLTHGPDAAPILTRAAQIAQLYPDRPPFRPLTSAEHEALPSYTFAAAAMEFLGAVREADLHHRNDHENCTIMNLGLTGLRHAAAGLNAP
ncbi:MAG: phosphotransferase [Pseudonocardia sp.]